jgi:hypothetical protein
MKKFKVAMTDFGGWNYIGSICVKGDFVSNGLVGGGDFTAKTRANADAFARNKAEWYAQFDNNQGVGFLVCRKTPRRGWVVVAQF